MQLSPRARALRAFVLAALIAGTVVLFEPLKSAVLNWDEISIDFAALLQRLLPPFALALAGLTAGGIALCLAAPRRGVALLVATYAALWAQGNLLVWGYGPFDGSPVDWSAHTAKGALDLLVWLGLFAIALLRPALFARRALLLGAAILALQAASLAGHLRDHAPLAEKVPMASPGAAVAEKLARFSSRANVLVIVLDSLQSDIFAEAMRAHELADAMPPGFTYYRNAVSLYVNTQFSLQSILTSQAVPDGEPAIRWRRGAMAQSVPARLTAAGFDAAVMTFARTKLECAASREHFACVGNAGVGGDDNAWRSDVSDMFGLGVFRLAPHVLKPRVYDAGEWRLPRLYAPRFGPELDPTVSERTRLDLELFERLIRALTVEDVPPRFRFLHFSGAHVPATIDADCRSRAEGTERERLVATTRCVLLHTYALLRALDRAGGYDASLVFIVGDHGHPFLAADPAQADPPLPPAAATRGGAPALADAQRGLPVFLAKPFGARHALRISDRPVSLCDVPGSIDDALDLAADFACPSVFGDDPHRRQPRLHFRYPSYREQRKRPAHLRDRFQFERYAIRGHSWRPEAWQPVATGSAAAK